MSAIADRLLELGLVLPLPMVNAAHSRSAVGRAELPFSIPVEIECELEIR